FTGHCRIASSKLSKYLVQDLIECFKQRLTGSAYRLFIEVKFQSVEEFLCSVKRTFAAKKTLVYYYGDLNQLRQKPNESIVRYACRTRDLESALLDASRNEYGGTWSEEGIKSEVLKKFINGTNHFIRAELKQAGNRDLTEAIENAIIIEQNIIESDPNLLYNGCHNNYNQHRNTHPTGSRTAQITRPEAGTELTYAIQQETPLCKLSNTTNSTVFSYNVLPFKPVKFVSGGFLTDPKPRISSYVRVLNPEIPKILLKEQE
ncbi:hypothetical protein M0802_016546, partial [Mischocyttarus mexicanus]